MTRLRKYGIVATSPQPSISSALQEIEPSINDHIKMGWIPEGNIAIERTLDNEFMAIQAVTLTESSFIEAVARMRAADRTESGEG